MENTIIPYSDLSELEQIYIDGGSGYSVGQSVGEGIKNAALVLGALALLGLI